MAAIDGHGTTLHYDDSGTADPSDALGEIVSIGGPNLTRPMIESTNMDSSAREFIAGGFYDVGTIDVEIQYNPGDTAQDAMTTALTAGTQKAFKITWSDTSKAVFEGFVESFSVTAEMEDRLTASMSIRTTGTVTITGA